MPLTRLHQAYEDEPRCIWCGKPMDQWATAEQCPAPGMDLRQALHATMCRDCEGKIQWSFIGDPDGPTWTAKCCGRAYWINIILVDIGVADSDEEDEWL